MPEGSNNGGTPTSQSKKAASSVPLEGVRASITSDVSSRVAKFIAKPATFSGVNGQNPHTWLKGLRRIYKGVGFHDDEIIVVAASYFTGPALIWWNAIESQVSTWNQLVERFVAQFASEDQIDLWWEELETLKQADDQSVDDIKFKCLELFEVLGITSGANKRRYFLRAIKPYIAQKITDQDQHHEWDELTASAKRIESSHNKYNSDSSAQSVVNVSLPSGSNQAPQQIVQNHPIPNIHSTSNQVAPLPSDKVANDDAATVSSLSTVMKELCRDLSALQLSINTSVNEGRRGGGPFSRGGPGRGGFSGPNRGGFNNVRLCYNCQQPGHYAANCPHDNRNMSNV